MAVQTGRTVADFEKLLMGAASGSMVDMKIDTRGDLSIERNEVEMSSYSDAGKGVILGQKDFSLEFGGPVDNTASTGPSTLLRTWFANQTLLSFDLQMGMRHAWENGEQQFGLSAVVATNSGVVVTSYKESGGKYKAKIRCTAGTAIYPDYGTAAEVIPA